MTGTHRTQWPQSARVPGSPARNLGGASPAWSQAGETVVPGLVAVVCQMAVAMRSAAGIAPATGPAMTASTVSWSTASGGTSS